MKIIKNKRYYRKRGKYRFNHKKYISKKKSSLNKRNNKTKNSSKSEFSRYCFKVINVIILIISNIIIIYNTEKNEKINTFGLSLEQKMNDYLTKKFAVFGRRVCPRCGLFCFYIIHLGCLNKYLLKGYIPIIDMQNYDSIYNRGNRSIKNPWELYFYQPNNYTLEEVQKYAKTIKYVKCDHSFYRPDELNIYYQNDSMQFWHNLQKKYMPIRNEIVHEAELKMKYFFGNSKNVLGVLIRGTDYIYLRPGGHAIPPKVERVITDVKKIDKKNNYDYIYFTSEDEEIKKKFIPEFKDKIRYLNPKLSFKYIDKNITNINQQIREFHDFVRIYVINIIIISKCLDVVISRCYGAASAFILTEGFRYSKVYNLGLYN